MYICMYVHAYTHTHIYTHMYAGESKGARSEITEHEYGARLYATACESTTRKDTFGMPLIYMMYIHTRNVTCKKQDIFKFEKRID